ncbi:hypothetical protein MKK68_02195 [Methylobacterium sp. E-016]|uniref:hypothetical protein n=1 Tax=Methylobacterium sp. E-016 TaxID=2836556 RepID=UPI001FB875AF|nr:hypothetical protein [Methylobacterium sp. E-016]MCJ2074472.1 hypothetical protein [Methylobacterium sp. E-016]
MHVAIVHPAIVSAFANLRDRHAVGDPRAEVVCAALSLLRTAGRAHAAGAYPEDDTGALAGLVLRLADVRAARS